ncbi:restriction endonuclease subunit S [Clostridium estertheticum]|uniref:restriction endonuclease subunit S n=1 Tax=Clostridium estertheticum TaxID=238834 RepID=UPI001C7D2C49|nr:restriction endonuclease subunit S [Clostridium estertheticum]MBX4271975.1 restriction endonuclease subunit S [Clostridium estertheticum]WLC80756.1 restriction endonuclease subunit S [Clostridium estertheticum]
MKSNEWQIKKLNDVCIKITDGSHKSPPSVDVGFYMASIKDMTNYGFDYSECRKISMKDYENAVSAGCKPLKNDILISKDGNSYLKTACVINEEMDFVILSSIAIIRPNLELINPYFIKYFLLLKSTYEYVKNNFLSGSAIPRIVLKDFKKIELLVPPIKVQNKIIDIILSLDNKIELNNQININLQHLSQLLFKQWFVDFDFPNEEGLPYKSSGGELVDSELGMMPKNWKIKRLNEIVDNIKVSTKPGEHLKDRKYIPIDTMPMKSVTIIEFRSYVEANSSLILFEKLDILIGAMRVYFHRVNLAPFKGVTRTTSFVLRSKQREDIAYNLFLLNLNETINYADKTSKGTTMPYAIWENGLGDMKIIYPTTELRIMFNNIILPMVERMLANADENRCLKDIRDTLVPKLMNGEIELDNKEINL